MDIFELAKTANDHVFHELIPKHDPATWILDQRDKKNHTPLFYALRYGNLEMVKLLLSLGATLGTEDYSPLMVACFFGHKHIVEYFFDANSLKELDIYSNTPLINAAYNGHLDIVQFLVEKGADINQTNLHGSSALLTALRFKHKTVADYLLAQPNIDAKSASVISYDAFVYAVFNGYLDIADQLWTKGRDLNKKYTEENTLLHMCTMDNNEASIRWLLAHGANPSAKNRFGMTPLVVAANRNYPHLIPIFVEQFKSIKKLNRDFEHAIIAASREGHREVVDKIIEYKDSYSKVFSLFVMLHAAKNGYWEIVSDMLDLKPKQASKRINKHFNYGRKYAYNDGSTMLHAAADQGHLEVVKNLVERGAKLDCKNYNHDRVLHFAVGSGNLELVQWLCQQKLYIDETNKQGETPLHLAVKNRDLELVRCLLDNGANPKIKNKQGQTPVFLARHQSDLKSCFKDFNDKKFTDFAYTRLHEMAANGQDKAVLEVLPVQQTLSPLSKYAVTPLKVALRMGYHASATVLLLWQAKGDVTQAKLLAKEMMQTLHKKSPLRSCLKKASDGVMRFPLHRLQPIQNYFKREDARVQSPADEPRMSQLLTRSSSFLNQAQESIRHPESLARFDEKMPEVLQASASFA